MVVPFLNNYEKTSDAGFLLFMPDVCFRSGKTS
jgi:hypothetical protein